MSRNEKEVDISVWKRHPEKVDTTGVCRMQHTVEEANKEWLLALPKLSSCPVTPVLSPAGGPSQTRQVLCQPFAPGQQEPPRTSARSESQMDLASSFLAGPQKKEGIFSLLVTQWCFGRDCWVVQSTVTTVKSWFTGSGKKGLVGEKRVIFAVYVQQAC